MSSALIKFAPFLFAVLLLSPVLRAEDNNDLARDEVAGIKKKLVAAETALGAAPEGYTRTKEDFQLPTSGNASGGKFFPISSGVRQEFGSKAEKEGKEDQQKTEEEFKKKYAEAMAKGDYAAMGQLGQEMQARQGKNVAKQMEGPKEPMTVAIHFNSNPYAAIDPDAVVFENPGVIALKKKNDSDEKGQVSIYFDPITLKDTKKLSKIETKYNNDGIKKKLGVFNITIDIQGPLAAAEAWAKKVNTKDILALIDADSK